MARKTCHSGDFNLRVVAGKSDRVSIVSTELVSFASLMQWLPMNRSLFRLYGLLGSQS
jgi:hypothetical protein